jgi:hypothetical protein
MVVLCPGERKICRVGRGSGIGIATEAETVTANVDASEGVAVLFRGGSK